MLGRSRKWVWYITFVKSESYSVGTLGDGGDHRSDPSDVMVAWQRVMQLVQHNYVLLHGGYTPGQSL